MTSNRYFINFDVKSYYSLLKSTISIDDLINWTINQKLPLALLIDDSMASCIEFYDKCIKNNIKPVIGLEIYYLSYRIILIARNNDGYSKLLKISSLDKFNNSFDLNNFLNNLDLIVICNKKQVTFNDKFCFDYNELAINKVRYQKEEDFMLYASLIAIKTERKLDEINMEDNYYFLNYESALKIFSAELISKTFNLINECEWNLDFFQYDKTNKLNFPKYCTGNLSSKEYLKNECLKGFKQKFNTNLINKKYLDRLNYELSIIDKMNLNDYFLVVYDFVKYGRENKILIGPGRGSSAGSLVSFLLNITQIDPIENNLIFERFLNVDRKNLPDIDIDVMDERREELINYIFNKYGCDNVSFIATYQRIKSKMSIRDVGRILGIDLKIIDNICKELVDDETIDLNNDKLKYFYDNCPKLFELAKGLINIPRNISTHAAGIIIVDKNVTNYYAIQKGINDLPLSQISMDYLNHLDLVKIDILGLRNLSIINDILEMVYQNHKQLINMNLIDKNDYKIFDQIDQANTIGIFQLESIGMRKTLKKIKPKSIEEISITSALFRPGPQMFIDEYVKTKNGLIKPKYLCEKLKPFLKPTLGFIIYQEQVIQVIQVIAGFSAAKADIFRRAISKKNIELFNKMKDEFIIAGIKNGFNKTQVKEIYDHLIMFANYGFNHSHSLSYAYISYWMMFLKCYYPLEFYLVLLKYVGGNNEKNILYINEAKRYKIKILNVNILNSSINFANYQQQIMFGFCNIKGIGLENAKRIILAREAYLNEKSSINMIHLIKSLHNFKIDQKSIEILIKVGSFDCFEIDRLILLNNLDYILKENDVQKILDVIKNSNLVMNKVQKFKYEEEYLSYTFSNDFYEDFFKQNYSKYHLSFFDFDNFEPTNNYLVYVIDAKKIKTKYNERMILARILINNNNFDIFIKLNDENEKYFKNDNYLSAKLKINNYNLSINSINCILN